jgi:hypothetical protein
MVEPPSYFDASDETGMVPDPELTGTPRWVKAFGIIAIVVALLFVILLVAGGGRHGPGRHRAFSGAPEGQAPSAGTTVGGRASPDAGH